MKAKLLPLLLLMAGLLPLGAMDGPPADFTKKISETFSIASDGRVRLENRYGEIKVSTWNQSKVKVDVLIRVDADSEREFNEVLDRIDVSLSSSGNTVSAVTSINSSRRSDSWWSLLMGGSNSDDFKIFYDVTLPASIRLDVDARYCDVQLPSLTGETYLDVGYGDLVAGRLSSRAEVDISYGSARIEHVGANSTVKFRYSEGSIRNGGDLHYDGRYSELRFGNVGILHLDIGYDEIEVASAKEVYLDGNYNELSVDQAESVYLNGNYTDIDLGTITRTLKFDGNYGDLRVGRLAAGFDLVKIDASYSDVELDVDDNAGYMLDLSARYGDIDVPTDNLSPRNIGNEDASEYVRGTKAGNGNGRIEISTNYGDIEIY